MTDMIKRKGTMFIFSAPSGGGKSSIIKELIKRVDNLAISVSVTTREKRNGEIDGRDYYFITEEKFKELVEQKALYEYVDSDFGPKYGTPKGPVDELLDRGVDVVLDLDYPGVQQLRALAGDRVKTINILPPSLKVLEERLVGRGTDSEEVIARRMSQAEKRIKECVFYDYIVVNNDLESAIKQTEAIILANRAARQNLCDLEETVQEIIKDK